LPSAQRAAAAHRSGRSKT